ncbi:MAG: spore coat protein [Candidatus Yanofskybacteria bacterium RIFCSPLOWO2_01_FULL_49_25]|uniref:glucose-1-phosphate thymidylyltransferase n=1 Tax=Candidatus Yanofskybacteria bacterium RIFCSPLOWO2_01_FULL_49_25 TaxID=1802701 RepID=A0A1F8GX88_9BACT|nr:MAG: spore coat protein [Candidatus Yanofskybacteria bacterium RIFCSPLOWO2_01_FULL_49_25]
MKGIILAGGLGTRLRPLTQITNKHLLPVYNKPMILYPLDTLIKSGLKEIMIVCGREYAGDFMNFLGSGKDYGVRLSYALQDKDDGGVADALRCAGDFADNESVAVILGDNIFEQNFSKEVSNFKKGAMGFFKEVSDPERSGVAVFNKNKTKIIAIEEKPKKPKSNFIQTGFYIFDNRVFEIIKTLVPSSRGQYEISDIPNRYIGWDEFSFAYVKGFWSDAGTFPSLLTSTLWAVKQDQKSR